MYRLLKTFAFNQYSAIRYCNFFVDDKQLRMYQEQWLMLFAIHEVNNSECYYSLVLEIMINYSYRKVVNFAKHCRCF